MSHTSGNEVCIIYDMLFLSRKAHMACNFNYLFESEGLIKVTAVT